MASPRNTKIAFDDKRWVIEIRSFFEEEYDDGSDAPICIFSVPNTIKAFKPEKYIPQLIALGPYHHWRADLYKMERYKLVAARRVQARFKSLKLQQLVDKLVKMDVHVRSCYHIFFDMDKETLAWMMAIDGIYLLDFLHAYTQKTHSSLASTPSPSPRLARAFMGSAGKKLTCHSILEDVMMLENQLPLFLLGKIMQVVHFTSPDLADDLLSMILKDVCKQISPIKLNEDYPSARVVEHFHLLDLLYHLIVPREEQQPQVSQVPEIQSEERTPAVSSDDHDLMNTLSCAWKKLSRLNFGIIQKINMLVMMPVKVISRMNFFSNAVSQLEKVLPSNDEEAGRRLENGDYELKAPLVEEIMIPSVTQLNDAGVEFCPTDGDITSIKFDPNARKLYLPVIHLDSNTEVIMRNLVAYEALSVPGPLVLARYTELMNGIIDTAEDAKILREKKIIINRLKSDQEVADLWNGMSRAIRLSRVPYMDKAIVEANVYYESTPKRKFHKAMWRYVYSSWRFLLVIATVLLLVLMGLQSFCSVFSCPQLFNTSGSTEDDD